MSIGILKVNSKKKPGPLKNGYMYSLCIKLEASAHILGEHQAVLRWVWSRKYVLACETKEKIQVDCQLVCHIWYNMFEIDLKTESLGNY